MEIINLLRTNYFSATIKYELDRNREMIHRLLSDISFQSGAEHE